MKPTSLLTRFWIEFFVDDLVELPDWVQRAVDRDPKLSHWLRLRRRLESDLQSQSDSWCERAQPGDLDRQASGISPSRIEDIFATRTPHDGDDEGSVEPAIQAVRSDQLNPTRPGSSRWVAMAVAVAVMLPLSIWFISSLRKPQGGERLAVGFGQTQPSVTRQVDFKPVLATAAASQRMAIAVKECSLAFLSRVADVTSSDALALPITDSAMLMQETADQWKESPKKFGLAMVRLLDSGSGDVTNPGNEEPKKSNAP